MILKSMREHDDQRVNIEPECNLLLTTTVVHSCLIAYWISAELAVVVGKSRFFQVLLGSRPNAHQLSYYYELNKIGGVLVFFHTLSNSFLVWTRVFALKNYQL